MLQRHVRIILCHLLCHLSPKSGRVEHIRLIDTGHFLRALLRDIKRTLCNPADLILIVGKSVHRRHHTADFLCLSLTEIQPSCQFSHNHKVESTLGKLRL